MGDTKNIRKVLVADDFHLCRTFFAEGLRRCPELEVFESIDAEDVLRQIKEVVPAVVLLNISMRHCSGMSLLQKIHRQFPEVGVLAFSYLHHDHLYAERTICAGAAGYISVDESGENLRSAVESIAAGGVYLNPTLRGKVCADSASRGKSAASPFDRLSHREFEVFCLTGHGYVPMRIAERLKLSVKTVETYRERIREKLGFTDSGELLFHASGFIREQSLPQLL
jgi:DNA-binding NarL/FixJ family response regulator